MLDQILDELSGTFGNVPIAIATLRLAVAIILGAMIGFEREQREKAAGLRTHILISLAACMFVIVSQGISNISFGPPDQTQVDPLRLIEAVTAGVAFLAAGAIFKQGAKVHNLTTGAGMWLAGAIGLACGTGQIPLAVLATVMCVTVLWVLRRAEQ
ncbi:MgtC/SapB family protein [Oceaniglobus ichthyenteri]|uniref:MgtC/SapB family protein n=1 Tax=Oceaniglobus ichthyenteri TaxID=2136177 RepID=UPI000D358D80|nr:MgtC/SapB family protein [Oceaniglobus ichthyenteri]